MLAARRFCFLLALAALFALAASLFLSPSLAAQVQGVPAMEFHGVPSSGIGGMSAAFSAVRPNANVPGYGAAAFGCCANFFLPSSFTPLVPYSPIATAHRERRHHHGRGDQIVGVVEPVYIPYAVPYAVDSEDAAEDQDDSGAAVSPPAEEPGRLAAPRTVGTRTRKFSANGGPEYPEQKADGDSGYDAAPDSATESAPVAPPDPPEPVVAQPTTVLVFKDGHRSEVVNYAIVGDTLFDFSGERAHKIPIANLDIPATQKANDASGVEFKLPPGGDAASRLKSPAN